MTCTQLAVKGTSIYLADIRRNFIYMFSLQGKMQKKFNVITHSQQLTNICALFIRQNFLYWSDCHGFCLFDFTGKCRGIFPAYGEFVGSNVDCFTTDSQQFIYGLDAARCVIYCWKIEKS